MSHVRDRLAGARWAAHHRLRSGRRPGFGGEASMEAAIGIALVILSVVMIILISRTAIANTPR